MKLSKKAKENIQKALDRTADALDGVKISLNVLPVPGPNEAIGIFLREDGYRVVLGSGETRPAAKEDMSLPIAGPMTKHLCKAFKSHAELLAAAKSALHLLDSLKNAPTVADKAMHLVAAADILEAAIAKVEGR